MYRFLLYLLIGMLAGQSLFAQTIPADRIRFNTTGVVMDSSGTRVRITGANVVVEPGSTAITTLGTITAGTWNGVAVTVPYGGTGLTSLTANRIPYGNGTGAFQSNAGLTFDGTTFTANAAAVTNDLSVGQRLSFSNDSGSGVAGALYTTATTGSTWWIAGGSTDDFRMWSADGTTAILRVPFGTYNFVMSNNLTVNGPTTLASTLGVTGNSSFSGYIGHPNYVSQQTAWRISDAGYADFRYLFANEMRIKIFSAEETAVYRAAFLVTKSYSEVVSFTCPASGGTTLRVRDSAVMPNARVFSANDQIAVQIVSQEDSDADGDRELTVALCVGVVTNYIDGASGNEGTQQWDFTRNAGANGGTMSEMAVPEGNLAIDWGQAANNNGGIIISAYDGAEGINAPYIRSTTWTTAPIPANMITNTQMGNLRGLCDYATTIFGFFAGSCSAANVTVDPTNGIRIRYGTTNRILIEPDGDAFFTGSITSVAGFIGGWAIGATTLSSTNIAAYSGAANVAHFAVGAEPYVAGMNAANAAGDIAFWAGDTHANRASAEFRVEADGSIFASDGTIGGWSLGTTAFTGSGGAVGISSAVTGGDDIRFWAGDTTPSSAEFSVTEAGALKARSGDIAGFTIGNGSIQATNLSLWSGAANFASILVGTGSTTGGLNAAAAASDIIFWGGATWANRATAPFNIQADGTLTASDLVLSSGNMTWDSTGITIAPTTTWDNGRSYKWTNPANDAGEFGTYGYSTVAGASSSKYVQVRSENINTGSTTQRLAAAILHAERTGGSTATISAISDSSGGNEATLQTYDGGSNIYTARLTNGLFTTSSNVGVTHAVFTQQGAVCTTNAGVLSAPGATNCTTSDERLKEHIVPYRVGLDAITQLDPIRFLYRSSPEGREHVGLSAQNVFPVIPSAVVANNDGYLMLDDKAIIATLVNAIKELSEKIERLERERP